MRWRFMLPDLGFPSARAAHASLSLPVPWHGSPLVVCSLDALAARSPRSAIEQAAHQGSEALWRLSSGDPPDCTSVSSPRPRRVAERCENRAVERRDVDAPTALARARALRRVSGSRGFSRTARSSSSQRRRGVPARGRDRAALERRVGVVRRALQRERELAVGAAQLAVAQRDAAGDEIRLRRSAGSGARRRRDARRPRGVARPDARGALDLAAGSATARSAAATAATPASATRRSAGPADEAPSARRPPTPPCRREARSPRRRAGGRARTAARGASAQAIPSSANAGRAEPGELPEPVERAVDQPSRRSRRARRRRRRATSGSGDRARARQHGEQRGDQADEREQRAEQPGLRERAQLDAVRIVRGLVAAPVREVLLGEVVGADAEQRVGVRIRRARRGRSRSGCCRAR